MQTVATFLMGLGGWNWLLVALLMFVLETLIPGVHFIWFGAAAVLVAVLTLIVVQILPAGLPLEFQLLAFGVLAVATVLWSRQFARDTYGPSDVPDLNERGRQYLGRIVIVHEAIRGGRGRVRVGDSIWAAEGPDMDVGAQAKVSGVRGTVLQVVAG